MNPNDPLAWQVQGIHRLWQGYFDEGIVDQERAVNLDPLSPIVNANLARAFALPDTTIRRLLKPRRH